MFFTLVVLEANYTEEPQVVDLIVPLFYLVVEDGPQIRASAETATEKNSLVEKKACAVSWVFQEKER